MRGCWRWDEQKEDDQTTWQEEPRLESNLTSIIWKENNDFFSHRADNQKHNSSRAPPVSRLTCSITKAGAGVRNTNPKSVVFSYSQEDWWRWAGSDEVSTSCQLTFLFYFGLTTLLLLLILYIHSNSPPPFASVLLSPQFSWHSFFFSVFSFALSGKSCLSNASFQERKCISVRNGWRQLWGAAKWTYQNGFTLNSH